MELIDILYTIAIVLVIVGAINWGATTLGYNLVEMVAGGNDTTFAKIVYYLVAAAGLAVAAGLLTKNIKVQKE